jgi:hypothetical protein|tara:strand:- start:9923 stop:10105 length:183 start_codon:yes stop_codon:yes gene_type:complete
MDKDKTYETFDLDTGLWEDTEDSSTTLKVFRKDFELYEAEREIVTRLLSQMLNQENESRD